MKKEKVLNDTIDKLQQLGEVNLREVNDFVDYLLHKVSDRELTNEIQKQAQEGKSFDFLNEEEELYSIEDLKDENRL